MTIILDWASPLHLMAILFCAVVAGICIENHEWIFAAIMGVMIVVNLLFIVF